ncbi:MAG: capsular biosynthesis protein CpsI [Legionellales bacterium]|nr:capsular biosynthesis protein CpsI [Legionellales bacterium]HBH10659.1 capsular biosynthesis protein CpsI [Gammaproteobacteria bacterium]|tara:strand:- start:1037 stop:2044 length:1008 start_codon:yes stop_codon:yes gene_type:complete
MNILITGVAGFIGFHTAMRYLAQGENVIGIDSLNDYYDVSLKEARLSKLSDYDKFEFFKLDINNKESLDKIFHASQPGYVIHLAAQAGVGYSIKNPYAYIEANINGFMNILEASRNEFTKHLVFASSSSVYGANTKLPFSVNDNVDHPLSLYAATKKSNELMAHVYSHLYDIPTTGLRFFTVYGPWGRPDMALFIFTKKILNGEEIDVFNKGQHKRDFTYIDDIVEGIAHVTSDIPTSDSNWNSDKPHPSTSIAPYRLHNIGNSTPVELMYFIELIEKNLDRKAKVNYLPLQPGDVPDTHANVDTLVDKINYYPSTSIEVGVENFIRWYKEYYKL